VVPGPDADAPTEVSPVAAPTETQPLPVLPPVVGTPSAASTSGPAAPPFASPSSFGSPPPPVGPATSAERAADGSGGGGSASKRNLLIGLAVVVVVAIVAFLAISGNDKDDTSAIRGRIIDSIQTSQSGVSDKDAKCVADYVIDKVGADRLKGVDFKADDPPSGSLGDDIVQAEVAAIQKCHVNPSPGTTAGGSDTGGTSGGVATGGIGSIGDIESFKKILTDQYESTLGLSHDKASCLANAMGEAVESGKLNQQDAFGDFFDYLDKCGISLDEISGANNG
jgi:hypothetical protein